MTSSLTHWRAQKLPTLNGLVYIGDQGAKIKKRGYYTGVEFLFGYQGWIQEFLKEGAPKSRTDRTSAPVETGGVRGGCAPLEAEKN